MTEDTVEIKDVRSALRERLVEAFQWKLPDFWPSYDEYGRAGERVGTPAITFASPEEANVIAATIEEKLWSVQSNASSPQSLLGPDKTVREVLAECLGEGMLCAIIAEVATWYADPNAVKGVFCVRAMPGTGRVAILCSENGPYPSPGGWAMVVPFADARFLTSAGEF